MPLPDLTLSTRNWTPALRRPAALLCTLIGLPVAILTGLHIGHLFTQADAPFYLNLAAGQPAMLPFSSRQLGPLLVRALTCTAHLSIHSAFYLQGVLSLLLFFATVLWFLLRSGAPRFMIAATVGLCFWGWQFNGLVLPDLFYAALLSIFILLLHRERYLFAALMMFPLAVARESTLLTLACLLIAGWRRLRLAEALTAIFSTAAGVLVVKRLAANTLPNHENISPFLYLVAKMPWAFVKNFLAINPWSNVYPSCQVPRWHIDLHLGPVHGIGICGYDPEPRVQLIFYGLASFGLFPLLFLAIRRRAVAQAAARPSRPTRSGLFLRFCVVYGALCFLLAGVLGESFQRLFAYSWPLFLVALPILLAIARVTFPSNRAALAFLAIHLLLSWSSLGPNRTLIIPIQILLWIAGWLLLRRTLQPVPAAV